MATTTITWKNNSTDQSPTATKIERYENFPKGHEHATAPTEVANSNTGGLDPTLANGTYVDTLPSAGKYYSYSVSTLKGNEAAEGLPSAEQWVADQDNDLGYLNGLPEIGSTYNCSVAPFLHIDFDRLKNYKSTLAMQIGENASSVVLDNGAEGFLRADDDGNLNYKIEPTANQPQFNSDLFTDGDGLATVGQNMHRNMYFKVIPTSNIFIRDGFTVFRAVGGYYIGTSHFMGYNGSDSDGAAYVSGRFTQGDVRIWNSATVTYNLSGGKLAPSTKISGDGQGNVTNVRDGTIPFYILAFRFNNTAEAYASGNIQGQVFSAGNTIATTPNVASKSYHNPSSAEKYGAFHLHSGGVNLLNSPSQDVLAGEHLVFGSALDANDMNQVFGYLCNKYGLQQNLLSQSDLVN